MYIIAALGNPGKKYATTRHNVGWILFDHIFEEIDWNTNTTNTIAYYKTMMSDVEVELIKPLTYMNRSGEAVRYARDNHEITNDHIIIIHDDIDICVGSYKISYDRGDAGHNGIASIAKHLDTKKFIRVRFGVAQKGDDGRIIKPNVLGHLSADEMKEIERMAPTIRQVLETIVHNGYKEAMNRFN